MVTAQHLLLRALLSLLLAGALVGIYLSATWMLGDIQAVKVRYWIQAWEKQHGLPALAELEEAEADIQRALYWEARNPEYIELHARILYYKALLQPHTNPQALGYMEQAKTLHRDALVLRPRWPYSWANLVLMKAYLNEIDQEYDRALRNAVRFGPWETSVHQTLTHAALLSWPQLSAEQKSLFAANVQRGLVYSFSDIRALLDKFNKRALLCAYLPRDEQVERLCKP